MVMNGQEESGVEMRNRLQGLMHKTESDVVAVGRLDASTRKLHWVELCGHRNERTSAIRQKATQGLSGMALRAGRPMVTKEALGDAERFNLGEAVMLTESLSVAAAIPLKQGSQYNWIILLGRRSGVAYTPELLRIGQQWGEELAKELVM
ncbi:GAF domain-containing protein [Paenibacillus chungangensis]|uniref:GAF domain-containing protein n=1 Tax=Paenibacillus chungangensis TaxID=696535 RepID=A0ABW3HSD1_9BACL